MEIPDNAEQVEALANVLLAPKSSYGGEYGGVFTGRGRRRDGVGKAETTWPTKKGVVIGLVFSQEARNAKLETGDLVMQIAGEAVKSAEGALKVVGQQRVGDTIQIVIRYPDRVGEKFKWRRRAVDVRVVSHLDVLSDQLVTERDELTHATITRHKLSPTGLGESSVSVQLLTIKGRVVPALRIMYSAPDWLFIDSYTLLVDGQKFELRPPDRISHENTHNTCWEWTTFIGTGEKGDPVTDAILSLSDCESAKVFYHGRDYRTKHLLDGAELHMANVVLDYFRFQSGGQ
jgi:hypothetical protein